jgi:PilS N terminal
VREFIVYSIVAILTVLGLVAAVNVFGQARDNQKLTAMTGDLVTLVQNIQAVYAGSTFTGIDNNSGIGVITGGMAPVGMVRSVGGSQALVNQFDGYVDVGAGNDGTGTSFTLTENSVPGSVCAKFASAFIKSGIKSLAINGSAAMSLGGSGDAALNPVNITKSCYSNSDNALTFEFGH